MFDEHYSTTAMLIGLLMALLTLIVLSFAGMGSGPIAISLGTSAATLIGVIGGFSQHKPAPLPPGSKAEQFSTVETPPTPNGPEGQGATK